MTLTWSAIPQIDVNGVFQQYVITYSTTGSISTPSTTTSQTTNTTINGLMFGTDYSFSVSVVSSGGTGPPAMISNRTKQDGENVIFVFINIEHCLLLCMAAEPHLLDTSQHDGFVPNDIILPLWWQRIIASWHTAHTLQYTPILTLDLIYKSNTNQEKCSISCRKQ